MKIEYQPVSLLILLAILIILELFSLIKAFHGSHRYILDYLVEEILNRQPPEIKAFLVQASILERMCWQLCDQVKEAGKEAASLYSNTIPATPERSSRDILDYLDRSNLFLIPPDNEKIWYRYHHLFAELLQARLQQLDPAFERLLHKRAVG